MKKYIQFELNNQNKLLNYMYKQDNIRIIDGMADNKKCIVICSSNGVYFPDTYEKFREKIVCDNYFEGGRMASLLIDCVERIILIRDIYKSYYVTGINERYNTIDKVLELLDHLTKGFTTVMAGSSSGGYLAEILGSYLNAEYVISFAGQWNLYTYKDVVKKMYFLRERADNVQYSKYFDLYELLRDNKTPILYIYGGLNMSDANQIDGAADISSLYLITINSMLHPQTVSTESYLRLLCADREAVFKLYEANRGLLVDIERFEEQINILMPLPEGLQVCLMMSDNKKQIAYNRLLYDWLRVYQGTGGHIKTFDGIVVAIWGKGRYCSLLLHELKERNVEVKCIVETQPFGNVYEQLPIVSIEHLPDGIDTIIVVPYYDLETITEKVQGYYPDVNVIGIDEYIQIM